jgi:8-oxo-dGTP pyrophosphatase MutT (NUDIX family)
MSWKKLESKELFRTAFFNFTVHKCKTTNDKLMPNYYVMDFPDWVQVLALDESGKVIVVEQYRYPGAGEFLELPGGTTNHDRKENPLDAAKRELLEETGYESEDWTHVGTHYPNPALQTNQIHVYLAKNCKKTSDLNLDPFEEIEVKVMPLSEFQDLLVADPKKHGLMLASMYLLSPFLNE